MTPDRTAPVRFGVVGLGNIGALHCRLLASGAIKRARLAAVCDADRDRLAPHADPVRTFDRLEDMLSERTINALLIALPHPAHVPAALAGLRAGCHVLVEKPLSTHVAACAPLLAAGRDPRLVLGGVYNMRTNPAFQAIRSMIRSGELGRILRVQWTVTDGFRPDAYYASAPWRGTWAGEGGGVLINQSSHCLDMLGWLFGRPRRVRAFCAFGRHHAIEVEDDVTAYCEFDGGATGTFITSNGEAPGTNRLEIAAEGGRLLYEDHHLQFLRNATSTTEFARTSVKGFATPAAVEVPLAVTGPDPQHAGILQNFTDAILDGVPVLAPVEEAIGAVELANAMLLSTWLDRTVDLPLDPQFYAAQLQARIDRNAAHAPR